MPYTIYATTVNDYDANTSGPWLDARNATKGTETLNPAVPRHSVSFNGIGWRFIRTYMEFDLSSVTEPITTMTLYVKGESVTGNTSYIAYGGQSSLANGSSDYSLYLTELIGSYALASGSIGSIFTAFPLDLTQYPPNDPPGPYVIGLVADVDFNNSENNNFDEVRIKNSGINIPYLVINVAGYPYEVSGVLGANITEVSGVPVANITNIMGV